MVQRVLRNPKPRPRFIEPMECKRVAELPEGDDWAYEISRMATARSAWWTEAPRSSTPCRVRTTAQSFANITMCALMCVGNRAPSESS